MCLGSFTSFFTFSNPFVFSETSLFSLLSSVFETFVISSLNEVSPFVFDETFNDAGFEFVFATETVDDVVASILILFLPFYFNLNFLVFFCKTLLHQLLNIVLILLFFLLRRKFLCFYLCVFPKLLRFVHI